MSQDGPIDSNPHAVQKMPPETPGASPMVSQPELIGRFLENQSQEIAVRSQEIAIREKEIETSHQYSNRALDAQAEDLKDERRYKRGARRDRYVLTGFSLLVAAGLFTYALGSGHEAVALEGLKYIVIFGAGGIGGYGLRKGKEPDPKQPDEDD